MIVMLGRLGAAAPTAGFGLELDAIVAVIIGGASFRGGTGRLRDTAVGVLFLAILNNGLSGLQMGDAQFFLIKGGAILAGADAAGVGAGAFLAAGDGAHDRLPAIDFGHTAFDAAFGRGDVYDIGHKPERAAKRPLTVAIAGCGGVAQAKWIPAIRRLQTIGEPVAIARLADPDAETAAEGARASAARRPSRASATMLDAARPDLLLVLAPDAAHVPLAPPGDRAPACRAWSRSRWPRSRAMRRRLVRFAEDRGVLLAAVANKRFSPPYAHGKGAGRCRRA